VVGSKRRDLVRQKKGRVSARGGEPCPAAGRRSRKFKIPKQGFSFFFFPERGGMCKIAPFYVLKTPIYKIKILLCP
jgi:hypothetical protein